MDWNKFLEIFADCELLSDKILLKSRLCEAVRFVKENHHYDILKEIIAIHNPDNTIELNYHLYSTIDEENLYLTFGALDSVESVADLFPSAIADENEIYDLFGVKFLNHEGLKRLYMPESWQGHPLRKDYKDMRLRENDNNNA